MTGDSDRRIQIVHATAPGCTWSWGFEAVINRLRIVYGDQVDIHLRIGCPYEDWEQWLQDYDMTMDEAMDWLADSARTMGVPMPRVTPQTIPHNVWPATLATLAAMRQGEKKGWRFNRALMRRVVVELLDPADEAVPLAAAREAGLDLERFCSDYADVEGLQEDYARQDERLPPIHAGFYNVVVSDGGDRRVTLDYAFDPAVVEEAVEYLAAGRLTKARPTDVGAYLQEHGLAPTIEVARVFGLPMDGAMKTLEALEKAGAVERAILADALHWRAKEVTA